MQHLGNSQFKMGRPEMSKSLGTRWLIAVAGLIALAAISAPSWAEESQVLVLQGYTVIGNLLHVTVENTGGAPASGSVKGTVLLANGATVTGLQAVSLGGGQTTTVTLGYTDAVSSTLDVRM
jgi:hypothetical protein